MTQYNKIGFHVSQPGYLNGLGDYVRALDAARIPAVLMGVGGSVGDIIGCWDAGSTVPHVVGVRYMPPDGSQDVPPYGTDPRQAAVNWWGWLYPRIGEDVKKHKDKCWIVTGNELDKNQSDWLGKFYVELAGIMHGEGFKLCALNFATGEPEASHWQTSGMLSYLQLCASRPQDTAVGLHEYSLADDLQSSYPHLIGRFEALHQVCDSRGMARPSILLTEWGWRDTVVPAVNVAMSQIPFAADLYAKHPNILGAGLWTLQNWQGGCIPACVQALIAPVKDYTLTARFPDPAPPDPPTPPDGDYKSVVFVAAQEHTKEQYLTIAGMAFDEYGRTLTRSGDNALVMVGDGNAESYGVIFDPDLPSQQAVIALFEAAGLNYQTRYLSGNPPDPEPEPEPNPPGTIPVEPLSQRDPRWANISME